MPLTGRRLAPGESPFRPKHPDSVKSRAALISSGSERKEQLQKLLNKRASRPPRLPRG